MRPHGRLAATLGNTEIGKGNVMRKLTLMIAAALVMVACQDKPGDPMKPKVAPGMALAAGL